MPTVANLPRILVVDDEPAIQRFLKTVLSDGEFTLYQAENGHAALAAAVATKSDVILLGLGLPDMVGVEVIDRIRQWSQVPILVLSVRDRESDKVRALDSGADYYLTKPFGVGELLARIRAMLRRSLQQLPESICRIDNLEVDLARRLVLLRGEAISLTPTEYDLLRLFVTNAGKVLTHRQILKQIWGAAYIEQPHILRANVSKLRQKTGEGCVSTSFYPHQIRSGMSIPKCSIKELRIYVRCVADARIQPSLPLELLLDRLPEMFLQTKTG